MWLLVGLGNPGSKHQNQRHNIGFMAVEAIARRHNFSSWKKKFQSEMAEGRLGTQKVVVLKPQTFMNLSGQAVQEVAHFYKVPLDNIIVFYDELDLAAGKVRIKRGGGAAGHNGIRSLDERLGKKDYLRVRLGIEHPGDRDRVTGHVLGDFSKSDAKWLEALLDAIGDEVGLLIDERSDQFMTNVAEAVAPFVKVDKKKEVK